MVLSIKKTVAGCDRCDLCEINTTAAPARNVLTVRRKQNLLN